MTDFDEKDIKPLDYIINHLVETGFQTSFGDLIREDMFKNENPDLTYTEFNRLASIIDGIGCAHVNLPGNVDLVTVIVSNGKTANFQAQGGFKKEYSELIDRKKHSEIIKRKERNESKLSDWKLKTFWPVFVFGLFGGIYSGIDLFGKFTNKETNQNELITKKPLESELYNLRNSILTENAIDSLPKYRTDSLKIK